MLLGFRGRGSYRSAKTRSHVITTPVNSNLKWGYIQSMGSCRWLSFITDCLLNCPGTDQTKAMQNNSISL